MRGRRYRVPERGMRPTQEKVREAVFSSLADVVTGACVVDLFAGAGGYAIEAWSRGAKSVTAVETSPAHFQVLKANLCALQNDPSLGTCQAVRADAYRWISQCGTPADLIFADPPYAEADLPRLLDAARDALSPDGILIFETNQPVPAPLPAPWTLLKEKRYGGTTILFLQPCDASKKLAD